MTAMTTALKIDRSSDEWKALKVKPFSPNQLRALALSTAPFNLWDGSIRSGKTFLSILWLLNMNQALPKGDGMILGQTPQTIERNFLNSLMEYLGEGNYHYKTGERLDIYYFNAEGERLKRRFYVIGAKDKSAIGRVRGSTLMIAYVDEATLMPKDVFDELVGRLSSEHAKLLATTNPDSPNHWLLKNYINDEQAAKDWRRFRFLLEDNLSLDPAYVERVKRQYRGIPARYNRMIKGKWVIAEGVIYQKFRNKKRKEGGHVINYKDIPFQSMRRCFVGVDYGVGNATVYLLIGEFIIDGKKRYIVIKEYYYSGRESMKNKTTSEFAKDFAKWIKGFKALEVVIDPSAAALITEFDLNSIKREAGVFYTVTKAKNDVDQGIQAVANMFEDDILWVCSACEHLIEELGIYSWDAKAQEKGVDKPKKENDHACDALRYAIFTIIGAYGSVTQQSA
jgi:PBSX family phage terminase large subunit